MPIVLETRQAKVYERPSAEGNLWIPVAELAPHQISGAQNRIFGELRSAVLFVMDELPPGASWRGHDPNRSGNVFD